MAIGIKTRLAFRNHDTNTTKANYWAGSWTPLVGMKEVPAPFGDDNMVDVSIIEDWQEMQEKGRASAAEMEIPVAFTKEYKDAVLAAVDRDLDMIILYGTDGKGREGVAAFYARFTGFVPDSATDDHLTATVKVGIKSQAVWIEDDYDVTVTEDAKGYPTNITLTGTSSSAKTIALDKATATLQVGGTIQLNATTKPANASVTWVSSDTSTATVTQSGLVSALAAGTTTITATNDTVSATCAITVSAGA